MSASDPRASCAACGSDNPAGNRFCGGCGAALARGCPSCAHSNPPDHRFCGACGAALQATERPGLPHRDPRAYTPKHLADKILQSKSALEGERKQVTVLFADVKGSMELAERLDPEEWHRILDRFFQILSDGVHRFEGTVNQYTGDGIMALFGAPIAHEDHAQRACYAALHLRDALRRHADRVRAEHGLSFGTRIGLNSGEVVVGKIGDDLRMDYTAQGQTVGLAQRMEQLAQPDTIYLAPATAELAAGYFECRSLGPSRVRGVGEPIEVFELVTTGALRTRLDASRTRGFSRFVGRAREMSVLETALAQARDGDGRVVGVVGEAGVGKSRLCLEFVERCRAEGITVFEAHCPAHGRTVPYLPFLEFLRGCFAISGADSDQVARDKIAGRLLLLDEGFREVLPVVFEFLGVPDPQRPAPPLAPEVHQRQLAEFLRQLVQKRSVRELAVLLWDDVHWIDPGSDSFLAQIADALRGTRTLLLANFRPEYHAAWMEHTSYERLPLHPLGPEATEALLLDLLGDDGSTRKLREGIRDRTGGTPFFIEEVVQSLVETGALAGSRGGLRLAREIDRVEIPDRVQTVLAARIDRLGEREKQVLRTAAVVGRSFAEPLLARVAELPAEELAASLDLLRVRELVVQEALFPEARFAFKHPLTHQVAYESQLREPRAHTHRRVALAIEELHADRLDELAALVADHWEAAGAALESARWHARAARWWASMSAPLEQIKRQTRVLELVRELPGNDEAARLGMRACTDLLRLAWRLGSPLGEVEAIFEEGRRYAEWSGDRIGLTQLLLAYARPLAAAGKTEAAIEIGIEALAISDSIDDLTNRTRLRFYLGDLYQQAGMNRETLALMEQILASPHDFPMAWYHRFLSLMWLGRLVEARAAAERTLELAPRIAESGLFPDVYECTYWWLAKLEAFRGHGEESLGFANRTAELVSARPALEMDQCLSDWIMGVARLVRGEWRASIAALESARTLQRSKETLRLHEARILAPLAEAYLGAGDRQRALGTAEAARRAGRELGTRHWEAEACLAHARALLADGSTDADHDAAASALDRADELVRETGNEVLTPFILEERAKLARSRGDAAAHARELRESHRLYTEMDATGHAERLARELDEIRAPSPLTER